jgi:hypothetical protein
MLRDWRIVLFFGLAATWAVWIHWWASLDFILTHLICGESKGANDCDSYNVIFYSAWRLGKATDHWSALITGIATVVLAVITWRLVSLGKEQSATTRAQLRAYLTTVVGQSWRQGATRDLKFEFRPIILNTGQTPAYDVSVVNSMAILSQEEAFTYDFRIPENTPVLSVMTLGPRQDRFTHVIAARKMTKTEMREYIANKKMIYVFGTIRYRDAFNTPHFTNFCYSIMHWSKRGGPLWHNTNRHNDSN